MVADKHEPVLLTEALAGLAVVNDGCYVDGTYGRGGHSAELLARLGPRGRLLALDKDPQAVRAALDRFGDDPRFSIVHAGFEELKRVVGEHFADRSLDGLLLDLGLSSPQLDDPGRGFSFARDGPLDMRMNTDDGTTAAQWLASASAAEIAGALKRFGEEPQAKRIAAAIVRRRGERAITTTSDLADIVVSVVPPRARRRVHPATRAFQAIRIVVNSELEALDRVLADCVDLLRTGGRLVVISFHSLEDRIVKRFIAREARGDPVYAGLPTVPRDARPRLKPVGKLIRPSAAEIERNPRARSARLRVAERLPGGDV